MTTGVSTPIPRPALLRLTPEAAGLCLLATAAWALTIREALNTSNGPGTMGLGLVAFVGM
jgi:hypothetical protein